MVSFKDKLKQQNTGEIYIKPDWNHPGFPKIEALAKLIKNTDREVKKEIDMNMQEIELMSGTYEGVNGPALRTKLNDIMKGHQPSSSKFRPTIGFSAYFNMNEMRTGIEEINKAIRKKIQFAMEQGSRQGAEFAADEIRTMQRRFKSKLEQTTETEGDIYHTIADSIRSVDVGERSKNQFITMRVGSYDIGDSESNPTGIRGSRMHRTDPSLVELTETSRKFRLQSGYISEGTKRIKRNLKSNSVAGTARYRRG